MRNPLWSPEYTRQKPSFNDMGAVCLNPNSSMNNGLVIWSLFNEGIGKVIRNVCAFPSGSLTLPSWILTPKGIALNEPGISTTYAEFSGIHFGQNITISLLINFHGLTNQSQCVISEFANPGNTWILYHKATGNLLAFYGGTGEVTIPQPSFDALHRITVINDGVNVPIFRVDGVNQTVTGTARTWSVGANTFAIGKWTDNWGNFYLADMQIWSRSLSIQEASLLDYDPYGTPSNPRFLVQPRRKWFVPVAAGGGTAYTKSLDASWAQLAGTLPKQVGKTFNAT